MLVVATENVPGFSVQEVKGQVFAGVVRSRGLGRNILAGLLRVAAHGGERRYAPAQTNGGPCPEQAPR
ncbi:uncharacterized protein E1O_24990 [Burkholderiales bacterium GJ-E10]|nr:uncharacterized protein E1O_24990 [Burkholderiales bacterium GJ-E10]